MNEIVYRRARQEEFEEIIKLQSDIFHEEQGIPEDDIKEFLARNLICWCAEYNGSICGTAIAWMEEQIVHWGRFVVVPSMRRHKIGTTLARLSFEDLFSNGVSEIHMTARDSTVQIVCNMGGEITGEPYPFFNGTVTPVLLRKENYR